MKINDIVYKGCSTGTSFNILSYRVIGIYSGEDGESFKIECQNCSHGGANCQVVIVPRGTSYVFSEFIGNLDESFVHHDYKFNYHPSEQLAKKEVYNYILKDKQKTIKSLEESIKRAEQELIDAKKWLDS